MDWSYSPNGQYCNTKKNVVDGKPHGRRPVGRPRLRWKDLRRHFLVTADYEDVRTLARDGGVC